MSLLELTYPVTTARPMDHYSQPYGQNFDLTVMDRTPAGLGDAGYAKMTERRTSSGGGNIYISPGIGLPPHSFAGGKLPMTSYQAGYDHHGSFVPLFWHLKHYRRCSATNESQPTGGFSYVNDQLISPNSIPLHFTTDQQLVFDWNYLLINTRKIHFLTFDDNLFLEKVE